MTATARALAACTWALGCLLAQQSPLRPPDVPFGASPPEVVRAMLELAEVGARDVVYDLGCGDGRIVITAAKEFGARGVGIDIDPERIAESRENARREGVEDRVEFRNEDLFEADIREATVVTLYLGAWMNEKLRPKLLRDLRPGTRVVSHDYDMGDWAPEKVLELDGRKIYLWRIPQREPQKERP